MRKLFTLLILSLLVINSFGQTTVTIGTGTSITSSSTSTITPYKTYWMDGQDQILFTAAELTAAGLATGDITALAFNVGGVPNTATLNSFTISAQQIAGTTLSGFLPTGWTTCYTGNVVAVAGWNTYAFTTNFLWNGTSSVVFKVCFNNAGYTSNSHVYYTSTPSSGVHYYEYGDYSTASGCDVTNNDGNSARPNVQITWQAASGCSGTPAPGNTLSSANPACVGSSFTLSLQNATPGAGVTYQWETSLDNSSWTPAVGATNSTFTTSQIADTYYHCLVTCAGNTGTSAALLVNTYTLGDFTEFFDGVTTPALPACWKGYISPSFIYQSVTTTTYAPYSLPNCVSLSNSNASLPADAPILVSPYLTNLSLGLNELRFFAKGSGTSLSVIVGTMSDPANGSTFTAFNTVTGLNTTTFTECIVSFATYSGTDKYIAFRHPNTSTYSSIYLDNIVWQPLPACPQPVALNTSNITNNSAVLNWTNGGTETTWNILWGPAGFDPGHDGTLISGITAHPYTLNPPLAANTSYDWYVQADCGVKAESNWSGPINFRTLCDPIPGTALPFTENFDAMATIGNNILPDCWKATSPSGTPWTSGNAASITYNDPCSAPNYVYVSYFPSAVDKFLITPGFSLKAGTSYDFKFNWVGDAIAGWTGDVWVNTQQSGTGATQLGAAFVTAATAPPATCAQVVRSFVAPSNGTYFFMVRVNNTGAPWYLGFDDFIVQESPACPDPTALTAAPAGFQATLDWTSTAPTFDIEWGATPYTFTGTANITGVTKPYILTGLTPVTGYTYKVMANCGGGLYSGWSAEKTFTTTVACPAPTALTAVPSTTSADLGWTEPGSATTWNIEFGPAGFTPTGTPTHTGVTSNPFNIGGLTSATSYSFYVQADCGGGAGTSTWSGPKTFSTLCNAFPAPYLEQFTTWPPLCWDLTGGTSSWMQYNVSPVYVLRRISGASLPALPTS